MKQKLYIAGLVNLYLILTGLFLKIFHLPGANIILASGLICFVVIYMPVALINAYRSSGKNLMLYAISGLTSLIVFSAMLFKIMHWPYANVALTVAIPFPYVIFLPVFLYSARDNRYSLNSVIFVLFLVVLNSVMNVLLS